MRAGLTGGVVFGLTLMVWPMVAEASCIVTSPRRSAAQICNQHKARIAKAHAVALFEVIDVDLRPVEGEPEYEVGTALVRPLYTFKGEIVRGSFRYAVQSSTDDKNCPEITAPSLKQVYVGYVRVEGDKQVLAYPDLEHPETFRRDEDVCAARG